MQISAKIGSGRSSWIKVGKCSGRRDGPICHADQSRLTAKRIGLDDHPWTPAESNLYRIRGSEQYPDSTATRVHGSGVAPTTMHVRPAIRFQASEACCHSLILPWRHHLRREGHRGLHGLGIDECRTQGLEHHAQ